MKKEKLTYCFGTGCPLKEDCVRFRPKLNVKREDHFSVTPYDDKRNKCGYFIVKNIKDEEGGNSDN